MRAPALTVARVAWAADPFVVALDRFEGPLDLLLHLIRAQDVDIFDIPIASITGQFIAAIKDAEELSLERAGEFLELAATLVRIKAQLLLPRREDLLEDEDPRSELVRRLLEYEQFREVAYELANAERERAMHFGKGYIPPRAAPDLAELPLEFTLGEFVEIAVSLPAPLAKRPHRAPTTSVTVDEKIEQLFAELKRKARLTLAAFVGRWKSRTHAVMSLLACLELAKRGKVLLRQERHFGDLWVYPREDDENS